MHRAPTIAHRAPTTVQRAPTFNPAPQRNNPKSAKDNNMTYNPNIHHRRSIRLKGYDYTQPGYYFITICTQNHVCLFGEIRDGEIILNQYGQITHNEWMKTADIRPNIELGPFVIMPNHIHGIIIIKYKHQLNSNRGNSARRGTAHHCTGTVHRAPTTIYKIATELTQKNEQFGKPISNSIPTIIRSYKSTVTKQINQLRNTPGIPVWQRNYWEHIIRNEQSYLKISEYIETNPARWHDDRFHPKQNTEDSNHV